MSTGIFRTLQVYNKISTFKEYLDYATVVVKFLDAVSGSPNANVTASRLASSLRSILGPDSVSLILNGFKEAAEKIGPNWPRMAEGIAVAAPEIAKASMKAIVSTSGLKMAEKRSAFKWILFLPTGPGNRSGDKLVPVPGKKNLALGVSAFGGRLFGFGAQSSSNRNSRVQFFRIDYWENFQLDLHYHAGGGSGNGVSIPF
jgi:hypothetical protein